MKSSLLGSNMKQVLIQSSEKCNLKTIPFRPYFFDKISDDYFEKWKISKLTIY